MNNYLVHAKWYLNTKTKCLFTAVNFGSGNVTRYYGYSTYGNYADEWHWQRTSSDEPLAMP